MMDRREFVALAGASAAGPATASGKVRAAFYGTRHSHAAGKLRVMLASPHYEVAGYFEPDAALRARHRDDRQYQGVRALSEEELLGDPAIRLVVVEGAVWEAVPWGRRVIAAGKHLHLEKPPGNQMAPFRELVEEARRKKLLIQVGYIWRFHEGIGAALDAARKGWLGEVYMVRGTINTDLDAGARQTVGRYRGGILFELGCHLVDRVVDLWGRPREVHNWLRHNTGFADRTADNTLAVLEYDHGLAVVTAAARMAGSGAHRSFEVIGTDGTFLIQPVEPGNRMRVCLRQPAGPYQAGWQEIELASQPRYVGDLEDMARALLGGTPLKYSYDYELLVQETVLRASGEET